MDLDKDSIRLVKLKLGGVDSEMGYVYVNPCKVRMVVTANIDEKDNTFLSNSNFDTVVKQLCSSWNDLNIKVNDKTV